MMRFVIYCGLCAVTAVCTANEPPAQLPQPHYHKKPSDPAWLEHVVQIHGHLGPWVVAGVRLGMAGTAAADAKGHFDVEATCEGPFVKPPERCFLDGIQVGTGATFGKDTIHWVKTEKIVVKVRNTRTGKTVEVRPTPKLMGILKPAGQDSEKPSEEQIERIAREIAVMPNAKLLTVTQP
jgi:formylmethanofuran dehydrogenase subunit E